MMASDSNTFKEQERKYLETLSKEEISDKIIHYITILKYRFSKELLVDILVDLKSENCEF